jgi:glucosylglycerate synthase
MASIGSNSSIQEAEVPVAGADIVVAIAAFNDVRTVGAVTRAVRDGLATFFGSHEARILLADAGSTDGTLEAARGAVADTGLIELQYQRPTAMSGLLYHGHPGRAEALRAIVQTTHRLNAKACALVDASLHSARPDWIERLIAPVLADGFDYVSPYYVRHAHEGLITKGIVYPVFRALYGVRLRQPAAQEFGCSARLVSHYLEQSFWDRDQASVGVDLWLAVAAATGGFRLCEAALGIRQPPSRETPADLSTTLAQIVGALFMDLEDRVDVWQRTRGALPVPVVGTAPELGADAASLNLERLIEAFRLGYRELREIWTWVLPPRTIVDLRKLSETPLERFQFDDRLWAGIIYDFAFGYNLRVMPPDHLLRSLTPLYTGWMASFVLQVRNATSSQVEDRVEQVCLAFEAQKRYLISRWRWPERLR